MKLGTFHTPEKAASIYDDAAVKYYGKFAKLNFPKDDRDSGGGKRDARPE